MIKGTLNWWLNAITYITVNIHQSNHIKTNHYLNNQLPEAPLEAPPVAPSGGSSGPDPEWGSAPELFCVLGSSSGAPVRQVL